MNEGAFIFFFFGVAALFSFLGYGMGTLHAKIGETQMKTVRPPIVIPHYHLTCQNRECGAVLECEKDELRVHSDPRETCYVLTCPHCKKESWFASIEKYAVRGPAAG